MTVELEIGELRLTFEGIPCNHDRAADISRQAVDSLEELLRSDLHKLEPGGRELRLANLSPKPVSNDYSRTSNGELAAVVAKAIHGALFDQLRIS